MKYGFIGTGKLSKILLEGLIARRALNPKEVYIYDIDAVKMSSISSECFVNKCANAAAVVEKSDIVILGAKPKQVLEVCEHIGIELQHKKPLLISLAVGVSLYDIEEAIGSIIPIIRILPNIAASVSSSVTAICYNEQVSATQKSNVVECFSVLGNVMDVQESFFNIFSVIASSAPAFLFTFADALATAAVREGMDKSIAQEVIAQMFFGSARLLSGSGSKTDGLVDQICSPGGTTIEGLITLKEAGFESSIHAAVKACMNKLT